MQSIIEALGELNLITNPGGPPNDGGPKDLACKRAKEMRAPTSSITSQENAIQESRKSPTENTRKTCEQFRITVSKVQFVGQVNLVRTEEAPTNPHHGRPEPTGLGQGGY